MLYLFLRLNKFKISLIYFYVSSFIFFFNHLFERGRETKNATSTVQYSVSEETTQATSFYFPIALYNNYDSPSIRSGNKS